MSSQIKIAHLNHALPRLPDAARDFSPEQARRAQSFHAAFPEYAPTPLLRLDALAGALGVSGIYLKDESFRFGLNAFKVLGGSYCLGRYIASRLGLGSESLSLGAPTGGDVRRRLGQLTFVTATDGNHGRGIAWTAAKLGCRSVVYMPRGSSAERLENIRALGAEASVTGLNYDGSVRLARDMAEKNGWVLVQDTAWPGYEEILRWIMQGYTTMALEISQQLGEVKPTHIFLQAGVGAMSGAVAGFFACHYGAAERPRVVIVEPENADCLFRTARANDGELHTVGGSLSTIMAGLACGEPCSIGWEVLRECADDFLSVPDSVAETGMRVLARPVPGDPAAVSGESGAVTVGLAVQALSGNEPRLREALGLGGDSRILCISTEGATDLANYRKIVGA